MKDHWQNITGRFEVHSDMPGYGVIPRIVGTALRGSQDNFFKVKFRLFPWQTYYLTRDPKRPDDFILYSGMRFEFGNRRFYHPVGHAHRVGLGVYYRIIIPDLKMYFFMKMTATDYFYNEKAA